MAGDTAQHSERRLEPIRDGKENLAVNRLCADDRERGKDEFFNLARAGRRFGIYDFWQHLLASISDTGDYDPPDG